MIDIEPSLLTLDPCGTAITHPASRYGRQPWTGSNVVPFPATANIPSLAQIAIEIATGRRPGGLQSAVMRRARDLHLAQVPVDVARVEIADYAHSLARLIDLARERQHAG